MKPTIYAATKVGLSISTVGGVSFNNRAVVNSGLGKNVVRDIFAYWVQEQVSDKNIWMMRNASTLFSKMIHWILSQDMVDEKIIQEIDCGLLGTRWLAV